MYPVSINNIHLHLDPGNSPSSTSPTVKLSWPWSPWALWRGTSPASLAQRASWGCSLVMGIPGIGLKNDPPVMEGEWDSLFVGSIVVVGIMLDVFFDVLFLIITVIRAFFFVSHMFGETLAGRA